MNDLKVVEPGEIIKCEHCSGTSLTAEIQPRVSRVDIYVYCEDCKLGSHIYTNDEAEKDRLIKKYEQIEGNTLQVLANRIKREGEEIAEKERQKPVKTYGVMGNVKISSCCGASCSSDACREGDGYVPCKSCDKCLNECTEVTIDELISDAIADGEGKWMSDKQCLAIKRLGRLALCGLNLSITTCVTKKDVV